MSYQKVADDESDLELRERLPNSHIHLSKWTILNIALKCVTCVLLVVCSVLVFVDIILRNGRCTSGSELHGFTIPRSYGSNFRYMSLSPTYDSYWNGELSPYNAMITLATRPDGSEEHGAIAMFHQLHCLSSLRMALQKASNGENIGVDWTDDLHWPHCLHHLREMILCFADDTVERGIVINGTRTNAISGARDVRMCRDPRPLYAKRKAQGLKGFKGADYSLDW